MSSKLTLGFRFHPTDEELINYLKNFELYGIFPPTGFIEVADLFEDSEPWKIMAASGEKTRYFLSRLKKFKNSTKKSSRTVGRGTWKGQRSDPIKDNGSKKNITIGYKRSLKYVSDIEKDQSDKWLMKEYFLPDEYIKKSSDDDIFVICKIKEKKKNEKKNKGVTNEMMDEEVDELIDYVSESIPDNHQVIPNDDENQLVVANEVNYEVLKTNHEASTSTLHEDYREGRSNYLEDGGVEECNGINNQVLGVEEFNDNCCIDYDELLKIIG